MNDAPRLMTRREQNYAGRAATLSMSELGEAVPRLTEELLAALARDALTASGRTFVRYNVIDMPRRIQLEVACPVDNALAADSTLSSGSLPAGRYATLVFTGIDNGQAANASLLDWIAGQGLEVDGSPTVDGELFAGRIETLLTDAAVEPDQSRWQTEVAIKVRND